MTTRFAHRSYAQSHASALTEERLPNTREIATATPQTGLAHLQRVVGNAGIQRMLTRPSVPAITQRGQAGQVHRKGCGCAACGGGKQEEEQAPGQTSEVVVQRWWDDEEESAESDSGGGGSWLDSVTETVTETLSDAYESVSNSGSDMVDGATSGGTDSAGMSESEGGGSESESDEGGGWWDDVKQTASDTYDSVMGEDESAESEGVDPDQIQDEVNMGGDSWKDYFPDSWFDDEDKTTEEIAEEHASGETTSSSGVGTCIAASHGEGEVRDISVAGLTTANFGASTGTPSFKTTSKTKRPKDPPKEGETPEPDVWDVKGKLTMTYTLPKATIAYTYSPDRSQLTACEKTAVDAYVKSTLAPHEDQHVAAFATFNGSETIDKEFNGLTGTEAEINTELTSLVAAASAEAIAARQQMAQSASDLLDPFNVPIPGLDACVVETPAEDEAPESDSSDE
ncbi:MAG: hypothetical protein KME04_12360 [Pleurocapsa minor GSE-CHR-MK-17-07R]|nr:hypothetical protein [Pleurocapsa minor GSE-CHR-MK 17-07R]